MMWGTTLCSLHLNFLLKPITEKQRKGFPKTALFLVQVLIFWDIEKKTFKYYIFSTSNENLTFFDLSNLYFIQNIFNEPLWYVMENILSYV